MPSHSAGYSFDYSIGFNGHFQLNKWTPLSIFLDNKGPQTSGNIEVIVTSGSEYQQDVYRTIYLAEVDLPQNSKKRYVFTIKIQSVAHELIIRLRQKGEITFSKSINLRSHFTEKNFAVVADNFVAPDILSVLPNHLHPANVRPEFLPDTWYGYESVKLIIIQADAIQRLRDRQFQALIEWLKQGGYLVVGTGLNFGSLGDKRLHDILPVRVAGHQQFFELKSLGRFCSRELTGIEPFLVLNARINGSKILLKENDIPVITLKKIGIGQIVFLSFDFNAPPFSRWDGRRIFWNKILSLQPKINRPIIEVDDQKIVNSMLADIPVDFPDFKSVLIFVVTYLICLWLILKKLKKPGKVRWQYSLFLILSIIIFTSIGYWGYYNPNRNQRFSYNSFCQIDIADPSAPAAAKYFIGLYSLIKLDYGLNFGSYYYPVSHIIPEKSTAKIPHPYVLQQTDSGQHILGSIQRWSHNFYKLNLQIASPLAGYARRDKSMMTLMVENKSPYHLVDCMIYYDKRLLFIDDILASNRQAIKLNLAQLKKKEIFSEHGIKTAIERIEGNGHAAFIHKTQSHLTPDLLLEIHNKYRLKPDSMLLVGWMPAGLIQPKFNQTNPPGAGITMISWELPVEITL